MGCIISATSHHEDVERTASVYVTARGYSTWDKIHIYGMVGDKYQLLHYKEIVNITGGYNFSLDTADPNYPVFLVHSRNAAFVNTAVQQNTNAIVGPYGNSNNGVVGYFPFPEILAEEYTDVNFSAVQLSSGRYSYMVGGTTPPTTDNVPESPMFLSPISRYTFNTADYTARTPYRAIMIVSHAPGGAFKGPDTWDHIMFNINDVNDFNYVKIYWKKKTV